MKHEALLKRYSRIHDKFIGYIKKPSEIIWDNYFRECIRDYFKETFMIRTKRIKKKIFKNGRE